MIKSYNKQQKKPPNQFISLAVNCVFPFRKNYNSALLSYLLFDYSSIPIKHVDCRVRALFILFLRRLENSNLNFTENPKVKLTSEIILTVLVRFLPQRTNFPESHFLFTSFQIGPSVLNFQQSLH